MLRLLVNPIRLLSMLSGRPREFWARASAIASSRWEASRGNQGSYRATDARDAQRALSEALSPEFHERFLEPALAEISTHVREGQSASSPGPFPAIYNGDSALAAFCYAVTRTLHPKHAVETGVCYGVTSAHILKAMEMNGEGHLDSIDVPPLGKDADKHVGRFIPAELRSRWTLHRGMSTRLLRPLLNQLGSIDLFVHDSLHTYRNMRDEFAAAWPLLRPGGVLISDDIQGNSAFQELADKPDVSACAVVEEHGKRALFGLAVKHT